MVEGLKNHFQRMMVGTVSTRITVGGLRTDNKILFWDDCWVREKLLKEAHPRMYSNPNQKKLKLDQLEE